MNLVEVLKRIPPTSTNYGEYILFSDIFDACGRGNQDILHYQLHDLEDQAQNPGSPLPGHCAASAGMPEPVLHPPSAFPGRLPWYLRKGYCPGKRSPTESPLQERLLSLFYLLIKSIIGSKPGHHKGRQSDAKRKLGV